MPHLSFREREIIKLRYGLGEGFCYTLEEIGHIFKITRERVRQIERKAVLKLAIDQLDENQIKELFQKAMNCEPQTGCHK